MEWERFFDKLPDYLGGEVRYRIYGKLRQARLQEIERQDDGVVLYPCGYDRFTRGGRDTSMRPLDATNARRAT